MFIKMLKSHDIETLVMTNVIKLSTYECSLCFSKHIDA